MARVESRLWWYRALHHLVAQTIATHPRGRDARIVDAGCGTGGLLMFLQQRGIQNLSGFDPSAEAVASCKERGLPVQVGDLRLLDEIIRPASVDVIISNDTLYFFSPTEQQQILIRVANALAPNGLLIMNVPALAAFRGIHDLSVGIEQRFTKSEIKNLFTSTGLSVMQIRFWPFLLSPIIYLARLRQRRRLRGQIHGEMRSDVDLPRAPLNKILEIVTRAENAVLPWKPFGSSLFVVARKNGPSRV